MSTVSSRDFPSGGGGLGGKGTCESRGYSGGKRNATVSRSDRRGASTGVRRTVSSDLQCRARLPDASTMQGWERSCTRRLPSILPLDHETTFLCPSHVTSPRAPFLPTQTDDAFGSWVYPHVSASRSNTCFVLPPSPPTAPDPSFPSTSAEMETDTDIAGSDVEEMEARRCKRSQCSEGFWRRDARTSAARERT